MNTTAKKFTDALLGNLFDDPSLLDDARKAAAVLPFPHCSDECAGLDCEKCAALQDEWEKRTAKFDKRLTALLRPAVLAAFEAAAAEAEGKKPRKAARA